MATTPIRGASMHYEMEGDGAETVLFIHGLMLDSASYDGQWAALRGRYRLLRYDLRGQGRSQHTEQGLDLESLCADASALIEQLGVGTCHVVGFSMGGFIALRLAARHPTQVRSLTLIGASAAAEEPWRMPRYALMIAWVRMFGPRLLVAPMMRVLFGRSFLADPQRAAERAHWRGVLAALPRSMARAARASAARKSIESELAAVIAPTLIVVGDEDQPIGPIAAKRLRDLLGHAELSVFPATGHAVMIERPKKFNRLLEDFLAKVVQP
jgi:pimeloyl-ACP methyl ester carboxylesterase